MTIREMIQRVNILTGQGIYRVEDLLHYFDEAIDEINDVLATNLPPISAVYRNSFSKTADEEEIVFVTPGDIVNGKEALDNVYTRIPAQYIRNYICYETSYRVLRDEDEDPEVYIARAAYAEKWLKKMQSNHGDFQMGITDTILVNDDVKNPNVEEDYWNPYFPGSED